MFVKERCKLVESTVDELRSMMPRFGYGGFGEFVFYRTYSREICQVCRTGIKHKNNKDYCPNCGPDFISAQEGWADTVIRVMNGMLSIRKDWYKKNSINWDEGFWQHYARHMGIAMFEMKWLPPGRGLWAMGTDFIYERGSMALNNCGLTTIGDNIGADISWMMDALMCGVGVGFVPSRNDDMEVFNPIGTFDFVIPDSREGWCKSVELLINCYLQRGMPKPRFIYDEIRGPGLPIRGFGGVSSGPEPLKIFHQQIEKFMEMYATLSWYDSFLLKTDIANCAGCCVVAGNVRRSAELLAGDIDDLMDLKNYQKYPYREGHGWMSNNSVFLKEDSDFERLGEIAQRILSNGEPGYINLCNLPFGRIGKPMGDLRYDKAIAFNPCGEQPLEDKELCTLVETCPTRCRDNEDWYKATEYAAVYATTVTLLPTHRPETNAVMLRNRRIGVGIVDIIGWKGDIGTTALTKYLREGYKRVRSTAKWTNNEAGVPEPIRFTTIKPGGTTPKLPGLRSGWQWPTFAKTLRRVRLAKNSPVHPILVAANVPHEEDVMSAGTDVFEFAIDQGDSGRVKPATEVSIWEQASLLVLLQREWSDNAVSNTLYFKPKWDLTHKIKLGEFFQEDQLDHEILTEIESKIPISYKDLVEPQEYETSDIRIRLEQDQWTNDWYVLVYYYNPNHEEDSVEDVLATIAPLTKSVAVLPHATKGVYRQMPEEGISDEEYYKRLASMRPIDWSQLRGSDGVDEKFCEGPVCEFKAKTGG